ncbi:MAG: glycosyltransferase [archaeon]
MEDIVLPDTSLCAIVRDEKMNPAGGVVRFLNSILPHVEEAVIVDTGSKDGTREILEQQKSRFPHLRVYDTKFEGYAQARNFSLEKVKTKMALVLDADEIITQEDFPIILQHISIPHHKGLHLNYREVTSESYSDSNSNNSTLTNRIFRIEGHSYRNSDGWKYEHLLDNAKSFFRIDAKLVHFSAINYFLKLDNWYYSDAHQKGKAPSEVPGFAKWKSFNPKRNSYQASNLDVSSSS